MTTSTDRDVFAAVNGHDMPRRAREFPRPDADHAAEALLAAPVRQHAAGAAERGPAPA